MGQEVSNTDFTQTDFDQFTRNLQIETLLLKQWFETGVLASPQPYAGAELEVWIVDNNQQPAAENENILNALNHPNVVPELSQFTIEINSQPYRMGHNVLNQLHQDMKATWQQAQTCAHQKDLHLMLIGILPTLGQEDLSLKMMSKMQRYFALNEQIFRLRNNKPITINISGKEQLTASHNNVMFESATTSLQLHLQVDPTMATRTYNASLIASAPMVGISANSPFLFGKSLWDETRIPLFEQAVNLPGKRHRPPNQKRERVTFGTGYLAESMYDCFLENLLDYPVILPAIFQQQPTQMNHLRLHNGTIWRWNRPLIGVGDDGRMHLRIEHRVAAAGPTLIDSMAHAAFYFGLTHQLAMQETAPEFRLDFHHCKQNFYQAAQHSLHAKVHWVDGKTNSLQALLLEKLIPLAKQGLRQLGVASEVSEYYLDEILRERIRLGRNGAIWQRHYIAQHPGDFSGLVRTYLEQQESERPVHQWDFKC